MIKTLFFALTALFLVACTSTSSPKSGPQVMRTITVVTGDLKLLPDSSRQFAWHPNLHKVYTANPLTTDTVKRQVRQAITEVLQSKGYQLVTPDESPAILVGFGLALESQMSDEEILTKSGLIGGLPNAEIDSDKYEKGTVLVALFSSEQQDPIWRVLTQGFVYLKLAEDKRGKRIGQLMAMMLEAIPKAQTPE